MHCARASIGLVLLLSCGKDDAKGRAEGGELTVASSPSAIAPAPIASATSAPALASGGADADAPPMPKCPVGLTANAVPAFCIKIPGNYAVKQARVTPKRGSVEFDTGVSTDNLMISYDETPIAQLAKDVESEMKFGGDKLDKKGSLSGGNKWFRGTHAEYMRIVTLVKGQGSLTLKCSFAYLPKKAPPKEAIEACKSIAVP